jgi:hypothetical protein
MRRTRLAAAAALAVAVAACAESATAPQPAPALRRLEGTELAQLHLLECAAPAAVGTVEADVGGDGAELALARRQLRVPPGAVGHQVRLSMSLPESRHVEVELHAAGHASYQFRRPVTVTIDYSRCTADEVPAPERLRVVHVDAMTKAPLEDMGGTVDPVARTITFETGHFSSYVVAD